MRRLNVARILPLVTVAALLLAPAPLAGEGLDDARGISWRGEPLEELFAEAREKGRLVLLDCWASWCTFCHRMDREVWTSDALARSLERRVIAIKVEVDVERGRGLELHERYGIDGLPAVLLLDPEDGSEIARLSGFQREEAILQLVDEAFAAKPDDVPPGSAPATVALEEASRAHVASEYEKAALAAAEAIAADPLCTQDLADDAALLLGRALDRIGRTSEALEPVAKAASFCAGADRGRELWSLYAELTAEVRGAAQAGDVIEQKLALFPSDLESRREYLRWAAESELEGEKLDDARLLAAELSQLDPDDPAGFGLGARLAWKAGDADEALELVERALEIDPHDTELRELRLRALLSRGGP